MADLSKSIINFSSIKSNFKVDPIVSDYIYINLFAYFIPYIIYNIYHRMRNSELTQTYYLYCVQLILFSDKLHLIIHDADMTIICRKIYKYIHTLHHIFRSICRYF